MAVFWNRRMPGVRTFTKQALPPWWHWPRSFYAPRRAAESLGTRDRWARVLGGGKGTFSRYREGLGVGRGTQGK